MVAGPRNAKAGVSITIIGAGLGGIATAVKLKQAGIENFTVLEQSPGPGGTWWDNTYPGCEVDVESRAYSFSFMPYDWPRSHCNQRQLQQYAEDMIDYFDLRSHFHFSTKVEEAVWNDRTHSYTLRTTAGDRLECTLLVSAIGMLNVPIYPDWPGIHSYRGPLFHSARWEHEHDFTGKRVAVVGTGCTAAQLVPELATTVDRLYLYQREHGWVVPKNVHDFSHEERTAFRRHKLRTKISRYRIFAAMVTRMTGYAEGTSRNKQYTKLCLEHIETSIEDPEIRKLVTPTYPFGCKRPVRASNFYPALNRPNVELIPKAVTSVTETGLVDADGVQREVDAVILATGFKAADYLSGLRVIGPDGRSVRESWQGEPKAYLGITVSGVPNFLMVYGPNTNGGGPITAQQECQADFIARLAKRMSRHGYSKVDTKTRAMERFVAWVDRVNKKKRSALVGGCHNYYFSITGRNVTQWPAGHIRYMIMTRVGLRSGLKLEHAAARS